MFGSKLHCHLTRAHLPVFFACVRAEDLATESDLFGISQEVHHYLELPCTNLAQTEKSRA